MFNENNPNGDVPTNTVYVRILAVSIFIGVAVMVKRVLLALSLGKKKYRKFHEIFLYSLLVFVSNLQHL